MKVRLDDGWAATVTDDPLVFTPRLLTEWLDLITAPVIDDLMDGEPAAATRLRSVDQALRTQRQDQHRADALHALIANLVDDYASR
ncbi:hypothetical protein [Streptomyces kanasensis]|uniref:hypothetical protein n=1 Tax=Streptomyces kanasensis TaxID=936756 RepID=UPI0012FFB8B0|nr:hypothetical protein [Streptomyces kanasensis]